MSTKLWLAPLHGITYHPFRNILFRHASGFDAAIAPFVPTQAIEKINPLKWKDLLPENNLMLKVTPQLMGNNASDFKDTVCALSELGYRQFNWNIGCPMKQITKKKRGCGLMPFPDLVEEVINNSCNRGYKLSVKMRLGMENPEEGVEIIRRLNRYPLDFIAIHPRFGIQQYEGKVHWEYLKEMLTLTRHSVIYSGDIVDIASFKAVKERFPEISQFMIGRGILKNPFLAEEIKEIKESEEKDFSRFIHYYKDLSSCLIALKGKYAVGNLKELWHYFSVYTNLDQNSLKNLLRIEQLELFMKETDRILERIQSATQDQIVK